MKYFLFFVRNCMDLQFESMYFRSHGNNLWVETSEYVVYLMWLLNPNILYLYLLIIKKKSLGLVRIC